MESTKNPNYPPHTPSRFTEPEPDHPPVEKETNPTLCWADGRCRVYDTTEWVIETNPEPFYPVGWGSQLPMKPEPRWPRPELRKCGHRRISNNHLPKKMIKMPGARNLLDSMSIMYGSRNGIRYLVSKHDSDTENTEDFRPADLEMALSNMANDSGADSAIPSLIEPEEARRIADDRKALVSEEIPQEMANPLFRIKSSIANGHRAQVCAKQSHPATPPAVGNPYRNNRAYNHYHQNMDRYRTGGVTTGINQPHFTALDTVEVPTPKTTGQGMAGATSPETCANQDREEDCASGREGLTHTVGGISVQSSAFPIACRNRAI